MLYYTREVKKMKYCELNIGDWFTDITGNYWIKTKFYGKNYNLDMGNTRFFGALGIIMPENTEVNFVSSHRVDLPNPRKRTLCTVRYAPILEPLYQSDTNNVIVLRFFNDTLYYVVVSSILGDELGIWRPVERLNDFVRLTSTFEYQVCEE